MRHKVIETGCANPEVIRILKSPKGMPMALKIPRRGEPHGGKLIQTITLFGERSLACNSCLSCSIVSIVFKGQACPGGAIASKDACATKY